MKGLNEGEEEVESDDENDEDEILNRTPKVLGQGVRVMIKK